jgi:anti-anti-sigma factor
MIQQLSFGQLERRNDICILPISGRLASGLNDALLRQRAQEIKSLDCRKLVVDIRALDSVGSSGITFFVELYTSVTRRRDGRFVLAGPSPRVREVLEMTRLTTILVLADDLESALAYCGQDGASAKATGSR